MTTFVVLAAGRGTRNRAGLHKALLPVDDRAVLTHLFELAPRGARLVVVVGHRANLIREYCELAHPDLAVTFVDVEGYDRPGSGPGTSLLATRDLIGADRLTFVTCDTLWNEDPSLWTIEGSWAGVAAIPEGTDGSRWCRIIPDRGIVDKQEGLDGFAWIGLASITADDLPAFWEGVETAAIVDGERQLSGGLASVGVEPVKIDWVDVGDQRSYRRAVGYDNTKPDEGTFLVRERVVKISTNPETNKRRVTRSQLLQPCVPELAAASPNGLAYPFQTGITAYDALDRDISIIETIVEWAETELWSPICTSYGPKVGDDFYRLKSFDRIAQLPSSLWRRCFPVLNRIDWVALARGVEPSRIHGDLNLSNIIIRPDGSCVGIDWRADFGSPVGWGDRRYDQAKLVASTLVHWGRARHGDFSVWEHAAPVFEALQPSRDVQIIAALSLLNSAPLHASPLNKILVERGIDCLAALL